MDARDLGDVEWRHSSQGDSSGVNRVEVAIVDAADSDHVKAAGVDRLYLLRDAKDPDGPVLTFTPAEWEAFVAGVNDGEFDI